MMAEVNVVVLSVLYAIGVAIIGRWVYNRGRKHGRRVGASRDVNLVEVYDRGYCDGLAACHQEVSEDE